MARKRDLERTQRLLRRIPDLEEVLEDLGLEILRRTGADAYCPCPDPEHVDADPSFHVCVEDVPDEDGGSLLGRFNCWSHPRDEGLRGRDFLDLVARIRGDLWDRWPTASERADAAAWLRREYLDGGEGVDADALSDAVHRSRERVLAPPEARELIWPPTAPLAGEFREYVERRGISPERAEELGILAVRRPGEVLRGALSRTTPGVLVPIRGEDGSPANWFLRAIYRVPSRDKARYCPGVPLAKDGVLWSPDPLDLGRPVALVEGIFDAERVRALLLRRPDASDVPPGNVVAALGGRLHEAQAARLRAAPSVIHLADGDDGGKNLYASAADLLGASRVSLRSMPPGLDPGDAPEDLLAEALRPVEEVRLRRVRVRTRGVHRAV